MQRFGDLGQSRNQRGQKLITCFGRRDAASGAIEEPDPQLAFQGTHGVAEG